MVAMRSATNNAAALLTVLFLMSSGGTAVSAFNYADALDKALLFFEAQRSGKLPPGQRVTWRGDSALTDGSDDHTDLAGGYYDAGDNVKFGLPMAFTVTMLSWSAAEFGDAMARSGQLESARAAVRWGADYLLKAAAHAPAALYVQVGDPYQDHRCWERPEDMDTSRSVYKVTPEKPGSDVAGETAAALAAASIVFRGCDPAYSAKLLQTARKVFDFADRYRGSYTDSLSSVACPFYCSYSGYNDELLWAAAWLHLATSAAPGKTTGGGNSSSADTYLSYIYANGHTLGAEQDDFTFSWDDKRVGTKVLLAKSFLLHAAAGDKSPPSAASLQLYKAHADTYVCSLIPGAAGFQASQYTPGGLLFKEGDSNMQYVTSTSFLLLAYAKYLSAAGASASCSGGGAAVPPPALVAAAKRQVDYILGANPAATSYMVGFGSRFPRHVHHRGASLPSVRDHPGKIGCDEGFRYLHAAEPDANVLVGAVVGGPDGGDGFTDSRDNYAQTEPSTYTNAPLVGALAFLAGGGRWH
ncbi:unnamed protein product [Urochloa decumbens]|uniref:Endoglucanase n=1 Tax=Urochloa decumbens TaxID=240449 RepID=A0ABC9EP67_9POAL